MSHENPIPENSPDLLEIFSDSSGLSGHELHSLDNPQQSDVIEIDMNNNQQDFLLNSSIDCIYYPESSETSQEDPNSQGSETGFVGHRAINPRIMNRYARVTVVHRSGVRRRLNFTPIFDQDDHNYSNWSTEE